MRCRHRLTFATTVRMWSAARVSRKPVHLNAAAKTKRMLPLRIFRTQRTKRRARALAQTKRQLDACGDATFRTGEVLAMPRHWLATGKAPGVLFRLFLSAFSF